MRYVPVTPLGTLEGWFASVANSAEIVAGVQAKFDSDVGVPTSVSLTGDPAASATEVAASLFQHLLEESRHPVVRAFLLDAMTRIGVSL